MGKEKKTLIELAKKKRENELEEMERMKEVDELIDQHVAETESEYKALPTGEAITHLISEKNYRERRDANSCEDVGVWVKVGDIAYIEFGRAFLNEAGFQHFGLVIKIVNSKVFVVPMTSKVKTYQEAIKKNAKSHLMAIGKVKGMNKNSVLFLNDYKSINSARIIDVKAHIPPDSKLFQQIHKRLSEVVL